MKKFGVLAMIAIGFLSPLDIRAEMTSLPAFAEMSEEQLKEHDIAFLNLVCASDLPGAENLNIRQAIQKLDYMANWIHRETTKNLYRFHREPTKFGNSEARFKVGMMITVLAQDFRCRYNPERGTDPEMPEPADQFFSDSNDLFIHGFLRETKAFGTCTSFPVLYAAIGRRLGYPIKLVTTKGHLFCRWDDANERFNIEGTNGGMKIHPDSHYKSWPYEINEDFIKANGHLRSLSPKEELANFLSTRAHCLLAHSRNKDAENILHLAHNLAPHVSYYKRFHARVSSLSPTP